MVYSDNSVKTMFIQQKEGQKWISHVILHIKMATDLLYFFECCTVLLVKNAVQLMLGK